MPLKFTSATTIAPVWIATLIGAYWIGTSRDATHRDGEKTHAQTSAAGGVIGAAGNSALGEAGGEGARTLSSSTKVSARSISGSASEKILHLLSGANGTDLKRSEFSDLAESMSLEEVVGIIDELAAMDPGPAQRDAYQEVLSRWAELDAVAALTHVSGIDSPKLRHDAAVNVLRHWAAVDPAAALAHVDEIDELPDGSLSAVFRGIGNSTDTTAALGFLSALKDERHQKHVYDAVRELFERNDAEVIAWTQSLPEGEIRDRSVHALIDQWARYDPIAAKAWVAENTNDSNRAGALVELGESWARVDPESAAAWAMAIDDSDSKSNRLVVERVFRRWMEYDIASAAGYLVEQEPTPELDGALEQYIQRVKNVDPDATMAWAESISDPKRRRNAVLHVAKVLRSRDKQAFETYVESSPVFTDAERNKLLGREKEKLKLKDKDKKSKEKKKDRS